MKTITLQEPGAFVLCDTPSPDDLPAGHALVRVHRVGICGTDLHAYRGRHPFVEYPRILGHELGVEVVDIASDVASLRAGDLCCVEPYLNCGTCVACRQGKTNCCQTLRVLGVHVDGGMRERIVVPADKLHRSEKLSLEQLALVETLGIGAHAVVRANVQRGEHVLVVGAGPIGLTVMQFAQLAGAKLAVIDASEPRLRFAQRAFDLVVAVRAGSEAVAQVRAAFDGDLPTCVFDATGNPAAMRQSIDFPAPGGRLVFVGVVPDDITFNDADFHRRELSLRATRNATAADFQRIIALIEGGAIDTTPWITHRAACDRMIDVFESWLNPDTGVIKAMVSFTD